jgi:hypothetical protein
MPFDSTTGFGVQREDVGLKYEGSPLGPDLDPGLHVSMNMESMGMGIGLGVGGAVG